MMAIPMYKMFGSNIVYIVFMFVFIFIMWQKTSDRDKYINMSESMIKNKDISHQIYMNDSSIQNIMNHIKILFPKEEIYEIEKNFKLFFDTYVDLLMNQYDEHEYNTLIDLQSTVLNIINRIDNQNIIGDSEADHISTRLLFIFKKYTNVIVEKYKVKNKMAVMQSNKFKSQYEMY